jgi:hypothetical protein
VGAAFLVRLHAAWGTYFNPDETLHYTLIHQPSLALAYQQGMTNAHPPLLYIVLYFWQFLGRSEWMMRMPSVIAGSAFCWFFFRWIGLMWGKTAALFGLVVAAFCPALVEVSAEVRHYALLLVAMAGALYALERAFREQSVGWMACFSVSLYFAILSHYSAVFFTVAAGLYCLMRMADARPAYKLVAAWVGGQAGAFAIYGFLYLTHVSKVRSSVAAWGQPFYGAYFHPQNADLADFTSTQTSRVFFYWFQQSYVAQLMLLAFLTGVLLLFVRGLLSRADGADVRQGALLLLLPFVLLWAAAIFGAYPYAGSRHTIILAPFAIAAASCALASILKRRTGICMAAGGLLMLASNVYGTQLQPYIARENQQKTLMTAAMTEIQRAILRTDNLFVDAQSGLALQYYLCGPGEFARWDSSSHPGFLTLSCGSSKIVGLDGRVWAFTPASFLAQFPKMVRTYGLQPGDRVWVFQAGWGTNLHRMLPEHFPQYRCLTAKQFGEDISIILFVVAPDFSPATPAPSC